MRRPLLSALIVPALAVLLAACGSAAGAGGAGGASTSGSAGAASSSGATESSPPVPQPYTGPVYAVGDSVMLGAITCMEPLGIKVDAAESRSFYAGVDVLQARADKGKLPDRVVVHLGTNGPISTDDVESLMDTVGDRDLYWINVHLPDLEDYYYADEVNDLLVQEADVYPNLHIIDWNAEAKQHPAWLYADDTHLTEKGCAGFARMVDDAVREPLPTDTP